ncbi:DUF4350 domain-containing protein [Salinirubellus salinus]|uniref:DUF4350 domain-containing protein n=1 Tax=Salinirubellus salinus TaxID=1364945 RepID=A0A9E7R270_9EURY|nr:DUF4350 domain-containing protein [Salinirubellus salinus]UWM54395.1 DUF4350 domain-containing protein [Salinirubellus salinus]
MSRRNRLLEWGPTSERGPFLSSVGLAALVVAVLLGLVVGAGFSTATFGAYNPSWDGTSEFVGLAERTGTETLVTSDVARYPTGDPSRTVAVVFAPRTGYDESETERISQFVQRGGTLVVASDAGAGAIPANELLSNLGTEARVDGRPLRDEVRNSEGPAMPRATNVTDHPLTRRVSEVTLNYGTVVDPGNATVLVASSRFAYLDVNGNDQFDGETNTAEEPRSFPVATVEQIGNGRVVVLGDPSVFINAMIDQPGNRRLALGLLEPHDRVVVDYSTRGDLPPLRIGLSLLRQSDPLLAISGFVAVAVLGAIARWRA